ncbi:TenA family protein [Roseibacterium sp. SDUM158017]|uniref:TenA family protein n=1 Tax=Roseicyclus salinarum TaxID=3036773 RepID=UPI0024158287|nr:TenA family protein [Roseibacterium sp. SDUM158017]MDG4647493.1 TenA family protein [Roseibacterium sp. SDUM158017]
MTALSDLILRDNAEVLARMLAHPFVRAVAEGTLPASAYHRYLVHEGAFVETAISIFAFATAKAPDLEAKRWLVGVQDALVRDQIPYFEQSFTELGVQTGIPVPEAVRAFDSGMLDLAREGDFLQIVTAMFAAEWMYWTWCSAAASREIADPHVRRWVDLHADDTFAAQARWLKAAIDRHGDPRDRERLGAVFGRVTELEIAFHDAPLAADKETSHA